MGSEWEMKKILLLVCVASDINHFYSFSIVSNELDCVRLCCCSLENEPSWLLREENTQMQPIM